MRSGRRVAVLDRRELLLELEQQLGALVEIGRAEIVEVAHGEPKPFWAGAA